MLVCSRKRRGLGQRKIERGGKYCETIDVVAGCRNSWHPQTDRLRRSSSERLSSAWVVAVLCLGLINAAHADVAFSPDHTVSIDGFTVRDENVVFHSPVVHAPQRGQVLTAMYLRAAVSTSVPQ